jgi:hypothetical protein
MIAFEEGLYVRIQELTNGPKPYPLQSGFCAENAYRVVGIYNASESSDAFLIMSNDRDELWFISNRHVRAYGLFKSFHHFRFPIEAAVSESDSSKETLPLTLIK